MVVEMKAPTEPKVVARPRAAHESTGSRLMSLVVADVLADPPAEPRPKRARKRATATG